MSSAIVMLATFAVALCLSILVKRDTSNIVYPSSIFILYSLVDVLIPCLIWIVTENQNEISWLKKLQVEEIGFGLLYYLLFYFPFIAVLIFFERRIARSAHVKTSPKLESRLLFFILFVLLLGMTRLYGQIMNLGGIANYALFVSGAVNNLRSSGDIDTKVSFIQTLPLGTILLCLSGLGFYFRKQFKFKKLFTYLFPFAALVFAVLQFSRGSILNFMFTFLFVEYLRNQKALRAQENYHQKRLGSRKSILIIIVVASLFTGYGAFRDSLRSFAQNEEARSFTMVPHFLKEGHGLLGISHIVSEFGNQSRYLLGTTYFDMLLLPVPRVIYVNKPTWYGIDDIAKEMGWPQTTQSAVTMPGEAYANFGIYGLIVAAPYALIIVLLMKAIQRRETTYVLMGPVIVFIIPTASNWMSFTGLMNCLVLSLSLYFISLFLLRYK